MLLRPDSGATVKTRRPITRPYFPETRKGLLAIEILQGKRTAQASIYATRLLTIEKNAKPTVKSRTERFSGENAPLPPACFRESYNRECELDTGPTSNHSSITV